MQASLFTSGIRLSSSCITSANRFPPGPEERAVASPTARAKNVIDRKISILKSNQLIPSYFLKLFYCSSFLAPFFIDGDNPFGLIVASTLLRYSLWKGQSIKSIYSSEDNHLQCHDEVGAQPLWSHPSISLNWLTLQIMPEPRISLTIPALSPRSMLPI